LVDWETPESSVQLKPTIYCTRNGHWERSVRGYLIDAATTELIEGERLRGSSTGVETIQLSRLRIPHNGEEIAADAVTGRLDQSENGVRGDGGIYRTPTLPQYLYGGLRG
jgi:hypothetical protein